MKRKLTDLPDENQRHLRYIAEEVRKQLPSVQMIVLYGSYAYGRYVTLSEREEFEVPTSFMSDYDILVLVPAEPDDSVEDRLLKIDLDFFSLLHPPIHFLLLSEAEMNKCLTKNSPFHTEIKRKGIVLYDDGTCKLAAGHRFDAREKYEQAQEYFQTGYETGMSFLRCARHDYDDGEYAILAFHVHQACEAFFHALLLTFTFDNRKLHDISKLLKLVLKYVPELRDVFPRDTKAEKLIFKQLKKAYTEGRYNKHFKPTHEEVCALLEKGELFASYTFRICRKQIENYLFFSGQNDVNDLQANYPEQENVSRVADKDVADASEIDRGAQASDL